VREAVSLACRVRLRPVLMTSLATLIGLIPMALKLGTGSEAYAPLARAIIGGLAVSVVLTCSLCRRCWENATRKPSTSLTNRCQSMSPMILPHLSSRRWRSGLIWRKCAFNAKPPGSSHGPKESWIIRRSTRSARPA
jgi:hypothetical protein